MTSPGGADLAALLALDGPIPVRGYLAVGGHRPGRGAGSCWPTPARTPWAATWSSTARSGPGPPSLHQPYDDAPDSRGVRYLTEQQIADHLVACTLAGVQAGFHAIGDDAVSAVGRGVCGRPAGGWGRTRTVRLAGCAHRIEHAEMADDEAIAAFAATGMVASMQPLFDAAWGGPDGLYARRLGAGPGGRDEPVRDHGRRPVSRWRSVRMRR